MIDLQNQEKQLEIQKLHKILQNVPKETKQEYEWQLLENDIFARMEDAALQKRRKLFPMRIAPFLPKNIPALAAAASLIIALGVGTFLSRNLFSPALLSESRILGIKGTVTYTNFDPAELRNKELQTNQLPSLFKNQVLETAENATIIVQIDKGSSFILSEKSKLTINKANSRDIEFFLHKGNILASVSKRKRNQSFTIVTSDAMCKVIGTIFSISVSPDENNKNVTNLTVMEGKVAISDQSNPEKHALVKTGQSMSMQNKILSDPKWAADDQLNIHSLSLLRLASEMSKEEVIPTGLLDLTSQPSGAKIFIQDNFIGKTPIAFNYPAGTYDVRLTLPGFNTWEEKITLTNLNSSFISAEFEKEITVASYQPVVFKKPVKKIPLVLQTQPKLSMQKKGKPRTKDFGFIMNPAFVEALVQMTIGEYQKALMILDSLKKIPTISITEKIRIMSKISACYKSMGNFENTVKNLTKRYNDANEIIKKSNLLWEIITVKANCLQDYEGAERDILTYIKSYPDGAWIESAYAKLGEIQYITGKYTKAVGTFQYHINLFKTGDMVEKSIYTLANIMRLDIKDYHMAIKWYAKFLTEYPSSTYYGNALFERADCYEKVKQHAKARNDYRKYLELYPEGHLKALCSSRLSSQE